MTALPAPTDLARQAHDDAVDQLRVGAVVDHDGRVLVLHRPDIDGAHRGGWELPSGTVVPADDLISALRRAVSEETGLDVAEIHRYLGEFDYTSRCGNRVRQHTWSVTVHRPAPIQLGAHQDYAWITSADDRHVSREVRALIRQHQHQAPAELPDPWPFADLVLRTRRLELRPDDDAGLRELALLGAQGVHLAEEMPMGSPWTDEPPEERCRNTMQSGWRRRAEWRPDNWRLSWLIRHRGRVIGTQLLYADRFAVKREVGTGSWLGLPYQGRGFGTEARAAVLAFAFDHLGAVQARTSAWCDNAASLRVSAKLGYQRDGSETDERRGEPATAVRLLLTREDFARHRPDFHVEVEGLQPCLPLLGATP